MGSSHSTRRRTGNQLSSAGFFHSAHSAKAGGDSSVCTGKSFVLPRISKRSRVNRSHSEKFAAVTGPRAAINRVASINGWTTSAHERTSAVTGDIVDESVIDGEAKSAYSSVPLLGSTVSGPYQPCGTDGWRMIDEDNINQAINDESGCAILLEACDASDPIHVHSELETFAAQAKVPLSATCSTIDVQLQNASCTTTGPVSGVIDGQNVEENVENFTSKTCSKDNADTVLEHGDNDTFLHEGQDGTLKLLHCDHQQKSSKICNLMKTSNTTVHTEEDPVSEACLCKHSHMRPAKPDNLALDIKQHNVLTESSVNSAISQDSGHASSVGVNSASRQVAAVNGIYNLCTSMCSLASDDLMLETEADVVSTPGCDSHQSSFDVDRITHGLHSSSHSSTLATIRQHNFPYPNTTCHNMQSNGFGDWQQTVTMEDGMQKQAAQSPVLELPSILQHRPSDNGDVTHCDHQTAGQVFANHSCPPRCSISDPTVCTLDGLTYRRVLQDITQFKTSLLKLKRLLQDDESRSILKIGSEYASCSSPFSATSMNGYGLDGSTPTTPRSSFSFGGVFVDDVQHNLPLSDLLQENADLKRQLACMQQVAQQQKATIVLLQQEMMKYRCEQGNLIEVKPPVS